MKYLVIVLSSIILIGCSSSKETSEKKEKVAIANVKQEPCASQSRMEKTSFTGETIDSLNIYKEGDVVYAEMNVLTRCDAILNVEVDDSKSKELRIKIKNENKTQAVGTNRTTASDCTCKIHFRTGFRNLAEEEIHFIFTNEEGTAMLANRRFKVE